MTAVTERPAEILVLGVGNRLRGDDGAGPFVLERLPPRSGVELRELHQLLPELAEDLAGRDLVVFVDACANAATDVVCRPLAAAPRRAAATAHHADPQGLLDLALAVYGRAPAALLVAVAAADFDRSDLSPGTRAAAERAALVVDRVLAARCGQPHLAHFPVSIASFAPTPPCSLP